MRRVEKGREADRLTDVLRKPTTIHGRLDCSIKAPYIAAPLRERRVPQNQIRRRRHHMMKQ